MKMKVRTTFVTNSSTSNFILGIKPKLALWSVLKALESLQIQHDLPIKGTLYDFAVELVAYASGYSILSNLESEEKVTKFWTEYWQKEQEEFVEKYGEDAAFLHEMEGWDRVYGKDMSPLMKAFDDFPPEEYGLFPGRALKLLRQGYAVYMFDVNDFNEDDKFDCRMREWGGTNKDDERCIATDDIVIWVSSYY